MSGKIGPIIQQLFVLDFTGDQLDQIATGIGRENLLRQLDAFFRPETCKRQVVAGLGFSPEALQSLVAPKTGADAYAFMLRFILGIFSDKPGETHTWSQFVRAWAEYHHTPHSQKAMVPLIDQLFNDARKVRRCILENLPRYKDRVGISISSCHWRETGTVLIVGGENNLIGSLVKQLLQSKKSIQNILITHPDPAVAQSCLKQAIDIGGHFPAEIKTVPWAPALLAEHKVSYICAVSGGKDNRVDAALAVLPVDSRRNIFHLRGCEGDASNIAEELWSIPGHNVVAPLFLDMLSNVHNMVIQMKVMVAYHLCAHIARARLAEQVLTTQNLAELAKQEAYKIRDETKLDRTVVNLVTVKELFERTIGAR